MFTLHCLVDDQSLDETRYRSEHGLAFAIRAPSGQILFDTGASGDVLLHNAAQLGIDLSQMDALALSHAHYDHSGGTEAFLRHARPGLPLYALPDIFRQRFSLKDDGTHRVGLNITLEDLKNRVTLHMNPQPVQILPRIWTTGEITIRTEFEGRSPNLVIRSEHGWQPDPFRDDLSLVLEGKSGLILVCGCCHAGLLNTLTHAMRVFNKKIMAIVGGTHMLNLDTDLLAYTITSLRNLNQGAVPQLFINHCTGDQAIFALKRAFGDKVNPCPAGTVLVFD